MSGSSHHLYDLLISNVFGLMNSLRGFAMRLLNRSFSLVFLFLCALRRLFVPRHGDRRLANAAGSENDELRQEVRELALRVTALEEELHRRPAAATESASLKPVSLSLPAADVRSSVESISSSGAETAACCFGDYAARLRRRKVRLRLRRCRRCCPEGPR